MLAKDGNMLKKEIPDSSPLSWGWCIDSNNQLAVQYTSLPVISRSLTVLHSICVHVNHLLEDSVLPPAAVLSLGTAVQSYANAMQCAETLPNDSELSDSDSRI